MSPALNGSSAIWCWCFKHSNVIRIRNGITFDFYTGLSYILFGYVWFKFDDSAFFFPTDPQKTSPVCCLCLRDSRGKFLLVMNTVLLRSGASGQDNTLFHVFNFFLSCHGGTFYHTYRRFVALGRSIVLISMTTRSSTSLLWVETLTQDHWLPLR